MIIARWMRSLAGVSLVLLLCSGVQAASPERTADPRPSATEAASATASGGPSPSPSPPVAWEPTWTTYGPADGAFTIRMPGLVTVLQTRAKTTGGTVPYTLAMVMRPDGLTGYLVSWAEYPPDSMAAVSRRGEQMLLATYQASDVATIIGGSLADQAQETVDGHQVRTWTVTYPGGTVEAHAHLVGPRLYTLKAVTHPDDDPAIAQEFFRSFTLAP